jgi:hypothetical protein
MAFLDNSGDIILDAVLTDEGRRRMARGNFNIVKFALGDDEIDYSLYNKTHPSGSAFFDLEILQTPIFEAGTQINAGINYGLLSNTSTDLLYLPVLKVNEKTNLNSFGVNNSIRYNGVFHVRDTSGDPSGSVNIVDNLNGTVTRSLRGTADSSGPYVLLETGLDTTEINGDESSRNTYLVRGSGTSLIDSSFLIFFDTRLFAGVDGLTSTSTFETPSAGNFSANLSLQGGANASFDLGIENYGCVTVNGINDTVYYYSTSDDGTQYSAIQGPRASAVAFAPIINNLNTLYTLYGNTSVNGSTIGLTSGTLYDYIDTTIYVQGTLTQTTMQVPIRIIRFS